MLLYLISGCKMSQFQSNLIILRGDILFKKDV
jgi:hypothetical protein